MTPFRNAFSASSLNWAECLLATRPISSLPFIGSSRSSACGTYSFAVAALVLIMIVACARDVRLRRSATAYAAALLILVVAVTAVVFVLVPGLGRPWNFLIFNPVIYLAIGAVVAWAADDALTLGSDALRRVALGALALLALNVAIAQANVLRMLAFQSTHRGSDIASMAIYPLIDALKARGVRTVVCMDYGPCQSIYILTAGGIAIDGREFSRDFDAEPFADLLNRPGAVMLFRRVFDVKDANWAKRISAGTTWFEERGRDRLPPLDIVVLPRVDDTQYAIAALKR
jgi:hypothetical protein